MSHSAPSADTGTILVRHGDDQYSVLPGDAGKWEVYGWIGQLHAEARLREAVALGIASPTTEKKTATRKRAALPPRKSVPGRSS